MHVRFAGSLHLLVGSVMAVAALAACYTGGSASDMGVDPNAPNAGGSMTSASNAIPGDLPCDVSKVLTDSCTSCHGSPLTGGAPQRLVSYADLVAPSTTDPTKRVIDMAITRMQDAQKPMPPSGLLPAADVAVLSQWVAAGLPKGTCGGAAAGANTNTPVVCTSNQTSRSREGSSMTPGQACINCHSQGEGPRYAFAGTVYPTAHEPDDCLGTNGTTAGDQVVITGADGATITIPVNSAGNFATRSSVAMPYTAKVISGGKQRVMAAPQTTGDCNSCHTEQGSTGAPGRVMAP